MAEQRFFIGSDNSGHEYLIPLEKMSEWFEWCNIPEYDERSWTEPEYAERVDGGIITFIRPQRF